MNFKSSNKNLDLWRALAVSLALHAWLLAQTLPQSALPRAAQPLAATLRLVAREPGKGIVESEPPARVLLVPSARAGNVAPAAVVAAPAAGEAARPSAQEARTAPMASAAVATAEGKVAVSAGLDADGVRQYRVNLAASARRFKRYPALAVERGLSGSAEVEVTIAASGMPQPPRLMGSSGHELLDEAALTMIGRAAQATILPASLRGRAFAVKLPVVFDLDDE